MWFGVIIITVTAIVSEPSNNTYIFYETKFLPVTCLHLYSSNDIFSFDLVSTLKRRNLVQEIEKMMMKIMLELMMWERRKQLENSRT